MATLADDPALPHAEDLLEDWIEAGPEYDSRPPRAWGGNLSELLERAAARGRLVETDRLLRDIYGPESLGAAHAAWTARLRGAVAEDTTPDSGVFEMLRRLRPVAPQGDR